MGALVGGVETLKMTVPISPGSVVEGANRIEFRFNRTNGVVSGFRVLAFNFLRPDGTRVLPPDAFAQDDPERWIPPRTGPREIATVSDSLAASAALLARQLARGTVDPGTLRRLSC